MDGMTVEQGLKYLNCFENPQEVAWERALDADTSTERKFWLALWDALQFECWAPPPPAGQPETLTSEAIKDIGLLMLRDRG